MQLNYRKYCDCLFLEDNLKKKIKILIVDDFSTMRRIIKNLLRDLGFNNTFEADDGNTALPMLKNGDYDFVVTDWNMPEMNGAELVRKLRSMPEYDDVPIVMITTRGMKDDVMTAMKLGVNAYVIKPFTPDVLKVKLDSVFK